MNYLKKTTLMMIIGILFFSSCKKDDEQPTTIDPPAITHYAVKFGEGQNWVQDAPIFQQELAEHITYQTSLFTGGTMKMAGFLLATDEARYFQKVSTKTEIDKLLSADPAIINKTFSVREKEAVSILIEQVPTAAEKNGKSYFLVEYTPGDSWDNSKKLWAQNLVDHQTYIGAKFGEKFVLRGMQYLNIDKAMYIVLASTEGEVEKFTNNDPAVINKIFSIGKIIPYAVNVEQL